MFLGKTPAPQSTHKAVPMTQTSVKYAKQNAIDLSPAASKWLASLDEKVRPKHLPERYPRIVNRMAELGNTRS